MGFWGTLGKIGKVGLATGAGFLTGGPAGAVAGGGMAALNQFGGGGGGGGQQLPPPQAQASAASGQKFQNLTDEQLSRARALQDQYQSGITSYDPQQYATQTAQAQAKQYGELATNMEAARRQATAQRGFLGSPIGTGAQTRDLNSRIATDVAANSQTAAGQRLSQLQGMGGFAQQAFSQGYQGQSDIYGNQLAQEQQARADANQRQGAWLGAAGQVLGAGLNAAGTYFGNRRATTPAPAAGASRGY